MPHIIPIRDLRDTNQISDMCHARKEPIHITKNGYSDMVIMSNEYYDDIISRLVMYDDIMRGVDQAEKGQMVEGTAAMEALRAKYGRKV